jgi:integrase
VKGKLIRRSLKTSQISVAKLRLGNVEKQARQRAEHQTAVADGAMAFADALAIYQQTLSGDGSLKPCGKDYREERIAVFLKSWPRLAKTDTRKISKGECLGWAADYGQKAAPSNFNNTVGTLRLVLDIAVKAGALYDNPARFIKRLRALPKKLQLPSEDQFLALVAEIKGAGAWCSRDCANLVRFLAFGGFRKGEAETITWADCDFVKSEILVRGDAETGTKNESFRRVPMIPEMLELLERLRMSGQPKKRSGAAVDRAVKPYPCSQARRCQRKVAKSQSRKADADLQDQVTKR